MKPIDPEIIRGMKVGKNVGYARNPGTQKRNQMNYQSPASARQKKSGKENKQNAASDRGKSLSDSFHSVCSSSSSSSNNSCNSSYWETQTPESEFVIGGGGDGNFGTFRHTENAAEGHSFEAKLRELVQIMQAPRCYPASEREAALHWEQMNRRPGLQANGYPAQLRGQKQFDAPGPGGTTRPAFAAGGDWMGAARYTNGEYRDGSRPVIGGAAERVTCAYLSTSTEEPLAGRALRGQGFSEVNPGRKITRSYSEPWMGT